MSLIIYKMIARVHTGSLLLLGTLLLSTGCAHKPSAVIVEGTFPSNIETSPSHNIPDQTPSKGDQIVAHAYQYLDTPYRYGGADPRGFDCSGLVHYTHANFGIPVPRTSKAQSRAAQSVSRSELQPGDLIFFRINKRRVSHVGIYTGNDQFIHAPSSGKRVSVESLNQPYWQSRLHSYGRFY